MATPQKNDLQRPLEPGVIGGAMGATAPSIDLHELAGGSALNILDGISAGALTDVMAEAVPHFDEPDPWNQKGPLEANTPPARPGMVQRWVRVETVDGTPDKRNVAKALSEKWRPRKLDDLGPDAAYSILADRQLGNMIAYGGMVLMERPLEWEHYYAGKIKAETDRLTAETRRAITSGFQPSEERYAAISGGARTRVSTGDRPADALMDD